MKGNADLFTLQCTSLLAGVREAGKKGLVCTSSQD